jgi:hypothetical protein
MIKRESAGYTLCRIVYLNEGLIFHTGYVFSPGSRKETGKPRQLRPGLDWFLRI